MLRLTCCEFSHYRSKKNIGVLILGSNFIGLYPMGFANSVGVFMIVTSSLISLGKCNEGEQQPNKAPGPGLYNSIGESINTPGKAMPTQIHLPHEENPSLILKDSVKKLAAGIFFIFSFELIPQIEFFQLLVKNEYFT